jgi:hypothetical protein
LRVLLHCGLIIKVGGKTMNYGKAKLHKLESQKWRDPKFSAGCSPTGIYNCLTVKGVKDLFGNNAYSEQD